MPPKRIDKYEVLEEIGSGGMGTVYKAIHPKLNKYVAIKEVRSDLSDSTRLQECFEHEAAVFARLPEHPNLVQVRDVLRWKDRLYLVMDYLEGGTLADVVREGAVQVDGGVAYLSQILAGLEAIHSHGIVHHDLKASNILLDEDGTACITDFGIAEFKGLASDSEVRVSARYAAPEVLDPLLGRGGIEEQIDIYATGIVGYELFLGEGRFRREFDQVYNGPETGLRNRWKDWHTNFSCVARNLTEIDPRIPRAVADVIERMMAKDVGQRYREASQARRDLQEQFAATVDVRHRSSAPRDDETLPVDRSRRAGGGFSGPSTRRSDKDYSPETAGELSGHDERPVKVKSTSKPSIPKWAWFAGAGATLLLGVSLLLFLAFMPSPGFTLEVRGAPAGSDVFVDRTRYGLSHPDGRITIAGLRAGSRTIKVSHDGYTPFEDVITARDGELKTVLTLMKEVKAQSEIDYNGDMILIPAGQFVMGDDTHEANERPAHPVTLPDYYIDKYEVTNVQYRKFCDETSRPYPTKLPQYEQYFNNNPNSPVMGISWDDAVAYADHYGKRLASEEEWEKAASWNPVSNSKTEY
ncbi:MAG TPA: SUMF1/EgtB/PvdO family nonheme iron enzyme, partial [Blastocatellia bacterium]|nr:SUMF1/EgtB/PvdO family nonheme iron enzyme [Blastocatellia bacterium]